MADDTIVRTLSNQKLKGLMKGKEEEENGLEERRTFGPDFEGLIVEMKQMLDQDLVQTA